MNLPSKLSFLLVITCSFLGTASAQEVKCPIFMYEPSCGEHELGVNVFSWTNLSINGERPDAVFSYASGILYKLHCRKNVFRFAVDGVRSTYEQGARYADAPWAYGGSYSTGDRTAVEARIGYERRLGKKKVQPYLGVDLGYRYQVDDGVYEGWGDFIYNPVSGTEHVTTHTMFLASFIGLNYRPVKRWSFTLEVSCNYGWDRISSDRLELSYLFPDERGYTWNTSDRDLQFDPIRTLAVSYHF
jgi:hypothetical protein